MSSRNISNKVLEQNMTKRMQAQKEQYKPAF